jgi:hypothetical protein
MKDRGLGSRSAADARHGEQPPRTNGEHLPFVVRVEGISVRDQTVRSVSIGVGDRLVWVTGLIALVALGWLAFQVHHSTAAQPSTPRGEGRAPETRE